MSHFVTWHRHCFKLRIFDAKSWLLCHTVDLQECVLDLFFDASSSNIVVAIPKSRVIVVNIYTLKITHIKGQYNLSQLDDGTLMHCTRKQQKNTYTVSTVAISGNKITLREYFSITKDYISGARHKCFVGGRNYLHAINGTMHDVLEMTPGNDKAYYGGITYQETVLPCGDAFLDYGMQYSEHPFRKKTYLESHTASHMQPIFLNKEMYGCRDYLHNFSICSLNSDTFNKQLFRAVNFQYIGSNERYLVESINLCLRIYDLTNFEIVGTVFGLEHDNKGKFISVDKKLQGKLFLSKYYRDVSVITINNY